MEYEDIEGEKTESTSQALVEYKNPEKAASEREYPYSLLQRRGRSLPRMHLALSTSSESTMVDSSGHRAGDHIVAIRPHPKSDNYEFVRQIGVDGEGVIDLVKSRSTRLLVVRKTVDYARSVYAKPIEAAVLQDILPERHNNIIRLHAFESYQLEGARYYFDYCSGGDLHQLVDQYRRHRAFLPEPFIWQVYQAMASALEFLHRGFDRKSDPNRRGICHRDIKPSNIFLRLRPGSEYPIVILADFGHATLKFATYDPAGTTIWQPPELPRHSPRADVYALGAVIHFLIHFNAPVAKLPDGVPDTETEREAWFATPKARRPIMEFVDEYSEELVCMMLVALEPDENKRKTSSQLLQYVSDCIKMKLAPGRGSLREAAEEWPLASWAFDHMLSGRGRCEEHGNEEEGTAVEQYFEMMERFGCCNSRESSQSSSLARYDGRLGVAGSSSRGCEASLVSSLSET